MNPNITLIDAVARNKAHPDTFHIPEPELLAFVRVGDYVKLGFEIIELASESPFAERMWVRVTSVGKTDEGLAFAGTLHNTPAFVPMTYGEPVVFLDKHILNFLDALSVDQGENDTTVITPAVH